MSPTVSQSGRRKPEVSVSDSGETRSFYSIQASPLKGAKLCLKEGMFTISHCWELSTCCPASL